MNDKEIKLREVNKLARKYLESRKNIIEKTKENVHLDSEIFQAYLEGFTECNSLHILKVVEFTYKNWKGETSERKLIPMNLYRGTTEFHKEEQLLLIAFDIDKKDIRTFAIKDIIK